jgi:hypothetical protein
MLVCPYLNAIRQDYPETYEDLNKIVRAINDLILQQGGAAVSVATGLLLVTAANGIIDIQINDSTPLKGEEYFIEYDTSPSFANARAATHGVNRNYRDATLANLTTYWRYYKSSALGARSNYVYFGTQENPTAVVPGLFSIVAGGPTPSDSTGTGTAQTGGDGYGKIINPADQGLELA